MFRKWNCRRALWYRALEYIKFGEYDLAEKDIDHLIEIEDDRLLAQWALSQGGTGTTATQLPPFFARTDPKGCLGGARSC